MACAPRTSGAGVSVAVVAKYPRSTRGGKLALAAEAHAKMQRARHKQEKGKRHKNGDSHEFHDTIVEHQGSPSTAAHASMHLISMRLWAIHAHCCEFLTLTERWGAPVARSA